MWSQRKGSLASRGLSGLSKFKLLNYHLPDLNTSTCQPNQSGAVNLIIQDCDADPTLSLDYIGIATRKFQKYYSQNTRTLCLFSLIVEF